MQSKSYSINAFLGPDRNIDIAIFLTVLLLRIIENVLDKEKMMNGLKLDYPKMK